MSKRMVGEHLFDGPDVADDPRWARVLARDRQADGEFWYSVATTGIYCRPSCPSRAANPENVRLHDTLANAQATGFRACKRCNPDASMGQSLPPSCSVEQTTLSDPPR